MYIITFIFTRNYKDGTSHAVLTQNRYTVHIRLLSGVRIDDADNLREILEDVAELSHDMADLRHDEYSSRPITGTKTYQFFPFPIIFLRTLL